MPYARQRLAANMTLACGGIVTCLLAARLVQVQHLDHAPRLEERDQQSKVRLDVPAVRGRILDRDGAELAVSRGRVKSLYAVPSKVHDGESLSVRLSDALSLDRRTVQEALAKERKFVWIKRKLGAAEVAEVLRIGDPALGFRDEQKRYYPKGRLACHAVGFVGLDDEGLEGAEAFFDSELRGATGQRWFARDALQNLLAIPDDEEVQARDGNDVWLTLDSYVQSVAEEELKAAFEAWAPISASCIVMSPKSGEVLAIACVPDFSPSDYASSKVEDRRNRAITDTNEPGSTFKPFTIAAALETGVVTPDTVVDCSFGARLFSQGGVKRVIHDYHPYGRLSVTDVLAKSSNIGTTDVAFRIPEEKYLRFLADLEIEAITGIELPGEASGWIAPKGWSFFSKTSVPWGQEVALTPLRLLASFNSLVNGGEMMRPSIVRKVTAPDGEVLRSFAPNALRRIVSEDTCRKLRQMLRKGVEKGTGTAARLDGYDIGGKTGTQTKIKQGVYSMQKSITSFMCFVPVDDPAVSMVVVLDEPSKGADAHHLTGGKCAAPAGAAILSRILPYLGVKRKPDTGAGKEK